MIKYFIPLILIVFIGCNESNKNKPTYFGGKIINPKCDFVILSDNYDFNDTIPLSKNNTFLGSYSKFKEGLYVFHHGNELQYIYMQPSDSLLIRLNTWDFDESLVFSGVNAERNNLLIESFLQYEQDTKNAYEYLSLPKNEFLAKIDSIKSIKNIIFENYKTRSNDASGFVDIFDISLNYPLYAKLEEYAIQSLNEEVSQKISSSYFDYRKNAPTNKDSLMFYGPYYRFIIKKIQNDAYQKSNGIKSEKFTQNLLHAINENVTLETVKNKMMYNAVIRNFYEEPNSEMKSEAFFTFFKLNTNNEHKKNVQRLINDLKILNKGEKLPSFKLIAADGELKDFNSISKNRNTVVLLKNYKYASDDWVSSRFNYLVKKNPDVNFVLVNLCDSSKRFTKNVDVKYQYTIPNESAVCDFTSSKFPRMILVDKNGIIQNGYTSLSAKDINLEISNLQKTK
ncbi:TlpA family protein disulfide reductase [Tenacibaculum sp. SDUM215027]|uniref:TlpA family protein disulfide reductase n=1 Tax=Tenacibaculum sp. SDUM215027 TaxID=3422596 RepID=UPI003D322D7A